MRENLRRHLKYYTAFILMQIAGFFVLLSLAGYRNLQIGIIFLSSAAYVIWAIIHQHLEHSLTTRIVIEYVLFGLFGLVAALLFFK